ncbi:MAG: DPP IV N-terminal domain-containing protein [Pseudonocardiaceae bacterium]
MTWGQAEYLAAEELPRKHGFWWTPDGTALVATRVDVSQMERWHLCDPVDPVNVPVAVTFPRAGAANADVSLWRVDLDGSRSEICWDVATFSYLVDVSWQPHGPLTLLVQTRDQRTMRVLDAGTGAGPTVVVHEEHDPEWTEIVRGLPAGWLTDGRLVVTMEVADTRRLLVDGKLSTPVGLEVRRVAAAYRRG